MATKFTFPLDPRVGDRVEFVTISTEKLPVNIVGNAEAGKNLTIIMPDQSHTGDADGTTVILSLNALNSVFTFKCVSTETAHVWVLEGTGGYANLNTRLTAIEDALSDL